MKTIVSVFLSLTWFLFTSLALSQEGAGKLGTVHFPVSCNAEAQKGFNRAVALLHSFWTGSSLKAFTAITDTDPGCAMGYWGIAMSLLGNPLANVPRAPALKRGWAAVEKAKSIGARTERERDYIAAIEVLYKDWDKLDHGTRSLAYEKAMERLYLSYPEDREAAIFYALALNMTVDRTDKTYANQLKAAAILEKVFAEQPDHPGVAHYLIHNYDYPSLATRGLPAARRYANIAPSVPHVLHMPSHIFTQLGMWQESIQSNRAAAAAAAKEGDVGQQFHATSFLAYAYLQGAQDLEAKRVLDELNAIQKFEEVQAVAMFYAGIPARYALERRAWSEAASLELHPSVFPWSRFPQAEAMIYFARALGSARSGNAVSAGKDLEKLQSLRDALVKAKDKDRYQVEIQHLAAAAWLVLAEGRKDEALNLMRSAAELEDSSEARSVAQIVFAHELLGEMLIERGEPAKALREFETSLQAEPNRFRGLYGAAKAAELSGDREKARTYYAKLVAICERADTERPELREAKAFLAKK